MNPPNPLPHPRALAHLGDAVYELWVREEAIALYQKSKDLHEYTTACVRAETQMALLENILPELSESEKELVKRSENVPVTSTRRSNQSLYRKSTAFEALIGYWYLQEPQRLAERKKQIFQLLDKVLKKNL